MKINYITNIPFESVKGGWDGINHNLFKEIQKKVIAEYIGPVNPEVYYFQKAVSKFNRLVGGKGEFYYLSEKRLLKIRREVNKRLNQGADYNFFYGQMPWTNCNFDIPYGVYMDACFPTYMKIFSNPKLFKDKDLKRIAEKEKEWLSKAKHLFFGSNWAMEETIRYYGLPRENMFPVFVGGNIPIPSEDIFKGDLNFTFISLNFEKKGGYLAFECFKDIKNIYTDAVFTIIGDKPPSNILKFGGVNYLGFLDKSDRNDLEKLSSTLGNTFLLLHPTKMDTMGAVIIEAGYFGTPAIAPKNFGIPDLIKDQETGFLIGKDLEKKEIVEKVLNLINSELKYKNMRIKVREYVCNKLTYKAMASNILSKLDDDRRESTSSY